MKVKLKTRVASPEPDGHKRVLEVLKRLIVKSRGEVDEIKSW